MGCIESSTRSTSDWRLCGIAVSLLPQASSCLPVQLTSPVCGHRGVTVAFYERSSHLPHSKTEPSWVARRVECLGSHSLSS
ncbi:uncharacterized protein LY79DRAFT_546806 [Colletotrichum navitas]|uniref:Uncharacterized protein n=1 Tax=Colletotrichum navitas TaxID=681940 RepID=A0AAD8V770_9PEZI|nr:uncharacterized protein LY79DRAFT_546806 [Colletotrichum navitas]KAK1595579.1 hypothetical protein LY79DRAFT_546806 [Colletotrichum navitas]